MDYYVVLDVDLPSGHDLVPALGPLFASISTNPSGSTIRVGYLHVSFALQRIRCTPRMVNPDRMGLLRMVMNVGHAASVGQVFLFFFLSFNEMTRTNGTGQKKKATKTRNGRREMRTEKKAESSSWPQRPDAAHHPQVCQRGVPDSRSAPCVCDRRAGDYHGRHAGANHAVRSKYTIPIL